LSAVHDWSFNIFAAILRPYSENMSFGGHMGPTSYGVIVTRVVIVVTIMIIIITIIIRPLKENGGIII
jgi:hypothetical protein